MSGDIFSAQSVQDVLIRMKDPKNGIKMNKKVLDPKKKKKIVYATGKIFNLKYLKPPARLKIVEQSLF